jgi:hypothetical protein
MQKAIDMGAKTVNIVPTIKFVAQSKTKIEYFCHQKNTCKKMTSSVIAEVESELRQCALVAARNGVNISFVPHIDDGGGRGIWRNNLQFDPLADYGGTSYKKSILDPIQRIVRELESFDIEIEFALQGEMGATVFHFPKSYKSILSKYRKEALKKAQYGLSINYNALGGQKHRFKKRKDRIAVQKLFNSLDFLGFSFYHPIERSIDKHFEFGKKKFLWELKKKRIKLNRSIPLHFSEIGLGGGSRKNDGKTIGKDPTEVGAAPYAGLYSDYDARTSPWKSEANTTFRFSFYKALNSFMKKESQNLPRSTLEKSAVSNKVTKAFIWNATSWDVLGIYPRTEGYTDERVIDLLFR